MESGDIQAQKDIEFFSQSVNAWLNLSLEYDKSLITLSSAAIGLVVTLLTTTEDSSLASLLLYALSVFCFAITIGCVLIGFLRSKRHIESVIAQDHGGTDSVLAVLDTVAAMTFGAGVLLLACAGIAAGISSYLDKGTDMTKKENAGVNVIFANDSINGLGTLRPSLESMNRLSALKPTAQVAVPPAMTQRPTGSTPPPLPPQKK